MPYATKADMLDRYEVKDLVQLTDIAEPYTGAVVDAVLLKALADASAAIDLYLGGRYDLPLSATPGALVDMCCVLAFYRLNRGRYTEDLRKDYEDVLRTLEQIAQGRISLDQGGREPKSAAAIAQVDGPDRIFNRQTLKGF